MDSKVKSQAKRRLGIVEGHLRKVRKMLEEDEYCPDVIHQSQAVQASLKKVDELILEGHLHTCVLTNIKGSEEEKSRLAEEIVEVFTKNTK